MVMTSDSRETFRFGDYVLDRGAYQLRKKGRAVRLERQPMDLLILLVERRGQLVTRAEIVERLWGPDVFVDVETGVHTAIRKVRRALGDSPDAPTFLETVPGKGYRFVAPVGNEGAGTLTAAPASGAGPARRAGARGASVQIRPVEPQRAWRLSYSSWPCWRVFQHGPGTRLAIPPSDVTLAVLPFDNLSGDPEAEYLASGLAEEVMVALGQIDPAHVHIVGRTSIMSYKHTTKSRPEIARELRADYLVESAVRGERGRVRITASLVRARDQEQVWSDTYDREPTSILSLQQELSEAIATQVRLRLSPDRLSALARRQTRNADAYDLYLRGRNFANQRTPETTSQAIDLFKRATALDPSYALAWAGLAKVYSASPLNADAPPLKVGPLARDAAMRAARTDPQLGEAQEALGHALWTFGWDWPAAERALRQAVALDPQSVMGHVSLGHLLSQMGQHLEAGREMRRARELDPLFAMSHALSSQVAYQAHDYQSAVEYARQAITIDPDFWVGHIMLGQAYEGLGRTAEALEELTTAAAVFGPEQQGSLVSWLPTREGGAGRGGPRFAPHSRGRLATAIRPAVRVRARARRTGRSRRRVSMARQGVCRARRPSHLLDCRSQMGSVSRRSAVQGAIDRCNFMHAASH